MNGGAVAFEASTIRPIYDLTGNPIADGDTGSGIVRYRVYGPGIDEPLAEVAASQATHQTSYLHHDGLGSITAATDPNGVLTFRNRYRAFGQNTSTPVADTNYLTRLSYTSRENSVGGLYQYRSRYDDSSTGRFVSADSYGGTVSAPPSLHRYTYTLNNPILNTDPSGTITINPYPGAPSQKSCATLLASIMWLVGILARTACGGTRFRFTACSSH